MKKLILSLIFFLLLTGSLSAQKQFDGSVKYNIAYEGETIKLNLFLNGDNFRMDKTTSTGSQSLLFAGGLTVVLYPAQTIYAEYNDINDALKETMPPLFQNTPDELKLTKTGEVKKILGVECEKWILKNQITSIEMYVAKGLKFNSSAIDAMPAYFIDWKKIVKKEKVLPLAIHIKDDLGNALYSFEAFDLSSGAPSKDLFKVPEKYKKTGKRYQ